MTDQAIRLAAFEWLEEQAALAGEEVLPWRTLANGFRFRGEHVNLLSQQGIFKPSQCELPISIRSSLSGPYDDAFLGDDLLLYRYQGTDPNRWDNALLRRAMTERVPLIYFHGVAKARYLAVWPVLVVADDPRQLTFTVTPAETAATRFPSQEADAIAEVIQRGYVTVPVRRRIHQDTFRERVLAAYREQCALCRLRHRRLLEAAHIIDDADEAGEPRVDNGLSLCKLHHAAYDSHFLGIRPDYSVEVRPDILVEEDGPMLLHGLKNLHGKEIELPTKTALYPDPERLKVKWYRFRDQAA